MKLHGLETRAVEIQTDPISTLDALREELLKEADNALFGRRGHSLLSMAPQDDIRRETDDPSSKWVIYRNHGRDRGGEQLLPIPQDIGKLFGVALSSLDRVRRTFVEIRTKKPTGE